MELTPFHGPPAAVPLVPGFTARTLLGFGAHGEVWLADDLSSGQPVAIKIGRRLGPASPGGGRPGGAGQEAAVLSRIHHPHVVRLHRLVDLPGDGVAMILDLAAGGSLASLVAARGPLDPGEVSTLLIPLTEALTHLHGRGVVHGDISPGNVLLTGQGRPVLGDLGVARVLGTRADQVWSTPGFTDPALLAGLSSADPQAADRWGLAAVAWFALTGHPPGPPGLLPGDSGPGAALSRLLTRCLAADPATRPGLAELADEAWRAARPIPVRLVADVAPPIGEAGLPPLSSRVTRPVIAGPGRPAEVTSGPVTRPRRVRAPRLRVGLTLASAGLLTAVLIGLFASGAVPLPGLSGDRWGSSPVAAPSGPAVPAPSASAAVGSVQLTAALTRIGQARAAAFTSLSPAALATADETGSPAQKADLALVDRLRAGGYRLEGVRYRVTGVRVLSSRPGQVDLRAVVTTSAHQRVSAKGHVRVPQDGPRPVVLTVVEVAPAATGASGVSGATGGDRWRVREVRAVSS